MRLHECWPRFHKLRVYEWSWSHRQEACCHLLVCGSVHARAYTFALNLRSWPTEASALLRHVVTARRIWKRQGHLATACFSGDHDAVCDIPCIRRSAGGKRSSRRFSADNNSFSEDMPFRNSDLRKVSAARFSSGSATAWLPRKPALRRTVLIRPMLVESSISDK